MTVLRSIFNVQCNLDSVMLHADKNLYYIIEYMTLVKIQKLFLVLCLLTWPLFWYFLEDTDYNLIGQIKISKDNGYVGCKKANLDPFHPDVLRFFKKPKLMTCNKGQDWLKIRGGKLIYRDDLRKAKDHISCTIKYFTRMSDFYAKQGPVVKFQNKELELEIQHDFFRVYCQNSETGETWQNVMAAVHRDQKAAQRAKKSDSSNKRSQKLSVLMWGFDTVSRMHFMRSLPKSYKYLTEVLNGTVLQMYNIVGDGTPQALIPILTGSTELELPDTRKRMRNANYVNVYPFIWKNFSENGYVTMFSEDAPSFNTFTYRLKGFKEQPTDHYGRPFYLEASKDYKRHKWLCLGSKPRVEVMTDYVKQLWDVYSDIPKFAFGFHNEMSHNDFNLLQLGDTYMYDWFKGLKESNLLENTILIVMSDHGSRFAEIRLTQQGKLEERLPFFSFIFPAWFSKRFPNAYKNFQINSKDRLTTPFDIHATFLTILSHFNMGKDVKAHTSGSIKRPLPRSLSLFEEIPHSRNCFDAHIEPHWCTCLVAKPVNDSSHMLDAAQSLVQFINGLLKEAKDDCATLTLKRILRAEEISQNDAFMAFKKTKDQDGFEADLSGRTEVSHTTYQLQVLTSPNNAVYEASIRHLQHSSQFIVDESQISRLNMYGNQPHCILQTHQDLRKYCFCKK